MTGCIDRAHVISWPSEPLAEMVGRIRKRKEPLLLYRLSLFGFFRFFRPSHPRRARRGNTAILPSILRRDRQR